MPRSKDFMDKVEEYDQYILGVILAIVAIVLIWKMNTTLWLILGFIVGLGALVALNKGKKETINVKTDITPIALAVVLLFAALYYIFSVGFDIIVIMFVVILILGIAELYE